VGAAKGARGSEDEGLRNRNARRIWDAMADVRWSEEFCKNVQNLV
jgi:hypothetical protein